MTTMKTHVHREHEEYMRVYKKKRDDWMTELQCDKEREDDDDDGDGDDDEKDEKR